jgi:hypothetical protein
MRFMVLIKATADSEAGVMPSAELLQAMGDYNQQLIEAGVMLAGEGLQPTGKGARVVFREGEVSSRRGPFRLSDQPVSGFWIWQCATLDDAVEWLKKAPFKDADTEIRQIFEPEDFGEELTPENRAREAAQRERLSGA